MNHESYDDHREPERLLRSFADEISAATGCTLEDVARVARLIEDDLGRKLHEVHPDSFADHARRLHKYLLALREMNKAPQASADVLGWTRREFDACVERYLGSGESTREDTLP